MIILRIFVFLLLYCLVNIYSVIWANDTVAKEMGAESTTTLRTNNTSKNTEPSADVLLYLQALSLEKSKSYTQAAKKYQEALKTNPVNVLASKRLQKLAPHILTDHRKQLNLYPGYSKKANLHSQQAITNPIWFKDVMTGYMIIFEHETVGKYALFSLKSRHIKHLMYLITQEDESWQHYPLITLPGVSRLGNVLVYHQPGETLQKGFINQLVREFLND